MRHEGNLDYYADEITKREKVIEGNYDFLDKLDKKYKTSKKKKKES